MNSFSHGHRIVKGGEPMEPHCQCLVCDAFSAGGRGALVPDEGGGELLFSFSLGLRPAPSASSRLVSI